MRRPFPLKVLLPLALGVIVSIAVLVFSEFGYRRLDEANRRTTSALEMQTKVNDVMALITDAETGQRGYLLTGDTSYLDPYKVATSRIIPTLSELREVVTREGSQKQQERLTRLNNLVGHAVTTGKVLLQSDGSPWRPRSMRARHRLPRPRHRDA